MLEHKDPSGHASLPTQPTPARYFMHHVSPFSLRVKETEGVETIVRSSYLPTAAKTQTLHGLGSLRPCPGTQPQRMAPTGIVRPEYGKRNGP